MAKVKDDPASRLERLAHSVRSRALNEQLNEKLGAGNPLVFDKNWEDEAIRMAAALDALNPDFDSINEAPLEMAFEKFNLSPNNPRDWRALLTYFAFAHFGTKTTGAGRPRKWTGEPLCQLLNDVAIKRRENPQASNAQIFRLLTKDRSLKSRYGGETAASLKSAYKLALDPCTNETLALIRDELEQILREQAKNTIKITGVTVNDSDIDRLVPPLALQSAIEGIERGLPDGA